MCFVDNEGRMATTGCTLEVEEFAPIPDGRLFIQNKGKERFKVIKIISEKASSRSSSTNTVAVRLLVQVAGRKQQAPSLLDYSRRPPSATIISH